MHTSSMAYSRLITGFTQLEKKHENLKKKSHRKFPEQFEGLYINHSPSFDARHDCAAHFVIFLRGRVAQSHSMD